MRPRPRRSPLTTLGVGLVAALVLGACTGEPEPSTIPSAAHEQDLLSAHGLAGLDARSVIERLDATPVADRSTELMASIRPDSLIVSDASGTETSLAMPAEEFYVSVAPYVDQTHECFFHSLTTCRGELANEHIDVHVVDDAGTVLVDETMTTFDNGFVGLWLPRDITGTITLELDGRTVTGTISTGSDDPTCVTTLQLV